MYGWHLYEYFQWFIEQKLTQTISQCLKIDNIHNLFLFYCHLVKIQQVESPAEYVSRNIVADFLGAYSKHVLTTQLTTQNYNDNPSYGVTLESVPYVSNRTTSDVRNKVFLTHSRAYT